MRLQPRARAAPAAHRTSPCVATDVCTRGRTLYARLMHSRCIKCFCGGAKTMLFKGKEPRPLGLRRTAHVGRDAASAASPRPLGLRRTAHVRRDAAPAASPRATTNRTHVPHPAHSAPAILLSVGRACPRPPQAGYARNAGHAPNKKPSAEFARSANKSNKIPPGGVYVGRD